MKSIEKLRKLTICDEGEKYTAYLDTGNIADAIEAEIAERYMELPVDEDGITIRVGDVVQGFGDSGPVQHLELWDGGWVVVFEFAPGQLTRYSGDAVHHVKPRTLEDVLNDFGCKFAENYLYPNADGLVDKTADEIRELLGSDGEC